MIAFIVELTREPCFQVSMAGRTSRRRKQRRGIRQGCTLSPFLFTLILSAIMSDAVDKVREQHPMATTPMIPVMDLEHADDTVLVARTSEIATKLLGATESEAGKYGLRLNKGKVKRLAYGSDEIIRYADGAPVIRVEKVEYLGAIVHENGYPGPRN